MLTTDIVYRADSIRRDSETPFTDLLALRGLAQNDEDRDRVTRWLEALDHEMALEAANDYAEQANFLRQTLRVDPHVSSGILRLVYALNQADIRARETYVAGLLKDGVTTQEMADQFREKYPRYTFYGVDQNATAAVKFLRIVSADVGGSGRSVHAFVEIATGKLIKAAGWKAPAKSTAKATKGELLSQYNLCHAEDRFKVWAALEQPNGRFGGYLYTR